MYNFKKKLHEELEHFENKILTTGMSYNDLKCVHLVMETLGLIDKLEFEDKPPSNHISDKIKYNYVDWVNSMYNEDGSRGAKWTIQETTEIGKNNGIDFSKISEQDWYITLNMVYSDYVMIARKYNIDNISFYIDLAKEFLWDSDTYQGKDKLERYYRYIVNH